MRLSHIARQWNERWAYPKLIVATNFMFFERLEQTAGCDLKVLRGDLPNTDYTVGALSSALETGINRVTHDVLTSAEKLAACATMVSDYAYPTAVLNDAANCEMLFDEHTWGLSHPIGPARDANWNEKSGYAYRAAALAHDVLTKSTNRLADYVGVRDEGYHLVVFNPLAWARTDMVSCQGSCRRRAAGRCTGAVPDGDGGTRCTYRVGPSAAMSSACRASCWMAPSR